MDWRNGIHVADSNKIGTRLNGKLGVSILCTTPLCADNTSARLIANNPVLHECTFRFIHQHDLFEAIDLPHVLSHNQLADLFTKLVTRPCDDFLISKLILRSNPHQFEGQCRNPTTHDPSPSHQAQ